MPDELTYKNEAAALYDQAFARVSMHFVPFLMRAARIAPGMRVLDIAAGTGLAAEAVLGVVGPAGHVTAADLSAAMVDKARTRLKTAKNASVAVEDGQALSFSNGSFDAVICSLGLMFFPDPARGLAEFHRVLPPLAFIYSLRDDVSGHVAISAEVRWFNRTMLQSSENRPPVPVEIESACCRYCRGTARLIRREPLAAGAEGEMLTFECGSCGKRPKAIIQV
jgi:ubiquinone/menaquinone biosynthesis C-methylase UbiE